MDNLKPNKKEHIFLNLFYNRFYDLYKAKIACQNTGLTVEDQFAGVGKMITAGKGIIRSF